MTAEARTEAGYAGPRIADLSGFEIVSALAAGRMPPPPMAQILPFTLLPPDMGRVELIALPEARFLNPAQTLHGGWIMTLLDTAMALAAQTTLPPGEICPSHETSAKFLRPITVQSGRMHIHGHVLSRGRTVITLEGRIEDDSGRLHAHGTSTCLILRRSA